MIETHSYMVAGYVAATVIYVVYVATLWVGGRRLRRRLRAG
jgi:hypothetical protein